MTLAVDAVLFDLDDTLCVYERSVEELLEVAFDRAGVEPFFDGPAYRARFDEFLGGYEEVDELRERCFVAIARDRGRDPALARAVAAEYATAREPATVRPRAGAPEVVRRVARDYPVGLVTNGSADLQRAKLRQIDLDDAFEVVVFAGHDTAAKPDPAPFERALEALAVAPERAVHVGNSLRSDVAGAAGAGLYSVWTPQDDARHDAAGHPEPDARVDDIAALPERLS